MTINRSVAKMGEIPLFELTILNKHLHLLTKLVRAYDI
jgi:hypothetical protein